MNELFHNLTFFMISLILIEAIVYYGSLKFIAYLSRKHDDDSSNNFNS
jgi:hypothetical protein